MSDVKISDVFNLPVIIGNDGILRQKDGKLIDFTRQERESTVIAINEHDQLKDKVTEQAAEIERLNQLGEALGVLLSAVDEYLDYEHDGDPWEEDARVMGEMEINAIHESEVLDEIRNLHESWVRNFPEE